MTSLSRMPLPRAAAGTLGAALLAATVSVPSATAEPRITPEGCEQIGDTDAVRCTAHSEAMDRDVAVLVRPSLTEDNPDVATFLDGANNSGSNGWLSTIKLHNEFPDEDKTFVFPVMDSWTWTQDFDSEEEVKYDTFISEELPDWLESTFDIPDGGRGSTGIAGLSSGAYGAMNIAAKNPENYNAVWALSGLYDPGMPLQRFVVDNTATERSEYGVSPWESDESAAENNPSLRLGDMDMPVRVSAASGIPNVNNLGPDPVAVVTEGGPYEFGSMVFTREMQTRTTLLGKSNFHYEYDLVGAHDWDTWIRAVHDGGAAERFFDDMDSSDTPGAGGSSGSSDGSDGSSGGSTSGSSVSSAPGASS
ncbi:MAG TPA: trehalose corynomycolyl transferase [Candidatus Corynebacterium avicola]|uniref:Acyl-CoA:diacylglycerol acyltransferase n=1 Tax=Candidatus Corynebacterium avicola TaxID=2838527 RepID=A0A9D1RTA6_9CORY|nr:trehalose corynomycolyl transferase [Candidatus Corynebacterium avicola]